MDERISRLLEYADIKVAAVLVIAETGLSGRRMIEEKYHTKVLSLLNDEDICKTLQRKHILL